MDPEHLQLMLRIHESFGRDGWDGLLPFLHPEFEFHEPPEQPGATIFHGPEAARAGWAEWAETWTEQQSEPEEIRELADGRILVLHHERLRGRDGIVVEQDAASIFTFRDGKLLRLQSFWDRRRAFESAGVDGDPRTDPAAERPA